MKLAMIAAIAADRAIGNGNKLIYWLPDDLKRFKLLTTGNTIIMGSNTFRSLPKGALPNRRNVVLSRQANAQFEGADHYCTLEEALASCRPDEDIYIIGGSTVYQQAMPLADRLVVTHVEDTPLEADAFFPPIDPTIWKEVSRESHSTDEKHHFPYSFVDYERI